MADVYLARRRVAGVEKRLVIKRLRRDRHRDPRFLDMFIREAQLSMSLVQQNIVPVFDFGRIGDHVFLAMEYIEGRDLGSSLSRQRGSGMPPLLAAFIAAECCQALDHAHRRREQVIHRDVTARNVLLSWGGEVKLADFGIAAVVGEAAGMFGTPAYMAPEQANGDPVDARTDVYALGLVLWESLIGDHVRPADDRLVTLAVARSGELPEVPASIPPALAEVIRRATAVDPDARFSTAREMAEALDAFMIVERVREGGQTPGKRLAEWLAARWGDDRGDDEDAPPIPEGGGAVVTFLDDGEQGIRGGAHTQRSLAETAVGEDDEPPPPPPKRGRQPSSQPLRAPRSRQPSSQPLRPRAGTLPPPALATQPLRTKAGTAPPPVAATLPLPPPTRRAGTMPPPIRAATAAPTAPAGEAVEGAPPEAAAVAAATAAAASAATAQPTGAALAAADSPARLLLPSDGHEIDPWAAEEAAEAAAAAEAEAAAASAEAAEAAAVEAARAAPSLAEPLPAEETADTRGHRRRWLAVLALALAAALALIYVFAAGRRGSEQAANAQLAPVGAADATAPDATAAGADAAEAPIDGAEPPDAAEAPPDAARPPLDAAIIVRVVPRASADAGVGVGSGGGRGSGAEAAAAAALRPIWINALPWAFFTVDGDPKQHETPAMLKLPVGDHRVTFTNPQLGVSRTVTVTVPAQGEARHVEKMN